MPRRSGPGKMRMLAALCLGLFLLLPSCAWLRSLSGAGPGPDQAQLHWNLGLTHRAEGQLEEAARELKAALDLDPDMYQAYYQLGLVYQALGDRDQARATWEAGLERARLGPERSDYPRLTALAQIQSALAALDQPAAPGPKRRAKRTRRPRRSGKPSPAGAYAVLYSSNLEIKYARSDATRLTNLGYPVMVRTARVRGRKFHRVWVGCCTTLARARALARRMRKRGLKSQLTVMRPAHR